MDCRCLSCKHLLHLWEISDNKNLQIVLSWSTNLLNCAVGKKRETQVNQGEAISASRLRAEQGWWLQKPEE